MKKDIRTLVDEFAKEVIARMNEDKEQERGIIILYAEEEQDGNGYCGTCACHGQQGALVNVLANFLTKEESREVAEPAVQIANKKSLVSILERITGDDTENENETTTDK